MENDKPTFTFADPGKYTVTAQTPITLRAPPNYNISFHNESGTVGTLDFNGPEMKFTGNAEESAKVFIDWIAKQFASRLEQERQSVRPEERVPMKPEAWLIPHIFSMKGVHPRQTSLPEEKWPEVEGVVAWEVELFCDSQDVGVTDRNGVTHYPKPLYLAPKLSAEKAHPRPIDSAEIDRMIHVVKDYAAVLKGSVVLSWLEAIKNKLAAYEVAVDAIKQLQRYDCQGAEGGYDAGMEPGDGYVDANDVDMLIRELLPQSRTPEGK